MAKKNGTWKVIATIGGFIIVIIGAAVTYGMLTKDVERNRDEIADIKPIVKTHDRTIIGIQHDIEQILSTQKTMILTETANKNEILQAIGNISKND